MTIYARLALMKPATRAPSTASAEALAIAGLGFLAADTQRLEVFMSLSGLTPHSIRAAAQDPGFLRAVLEYIASEDTLLLSFAANEQLKPDEILRSLRALGWGPPETAE